MVDWMMNGWREQIVDDVRMMSQMMSIVWNHQVAHTWTPHCSAGALDVGRSSSDKI